MNSLKYTQSKSLEHFLVLMLLYLGNWDDTALGHSKLITCIETVKMQNLKICYIDILYLDDGCTCSIFKCSFKEIKVKNDSVS
jgi:hypothetical protein